VRPALVQAAGGYLRNVIREPKITCGVCAAALQLAVLPQEPWLHVAVTTP
jgi:hypothetical protein